MNNVETKATWTDDRVELLKKFWADGLSCSQIAGELGGGITRNAVIGKVTRLHLPLRTHPTGGPRRKFGADGGLAFRVKRGIEQRRQRAPRPLPDCPIRAVIHKPEPTPVDDLSIPLEQRLGILDLEDGRCRWPVGHPGEAGFFYCGSPDVVPNTSYCAGHCARAFTAAPPRRAAPARFSRYGTRLPNLNTEQRA